MLLLWGAAMLCLLVARCGDHILLALDMGGVRSPHPAEGLRQTLPADSGEAERAQQTQRDFEAMMRAEATSRAREATRQEAARSSLPP